MTGLRERLRAGPPAWLPGLIAISVLAATVAVGRDLGLPQPAATILAVMLTVGLIAVAVLSPALGVIALVAGSLANPLAFATETRTQLSFTLLALVLLAVICALDAVRRDDQALWRLPAARAALALPIAAVLAAIVGNLPWFGFGRVAPARAQLGGLMVYVFSATAFLIGADHLREPRWLRRLVCVFLGCGSLIVAGRLMPELRKIVPAIIAQFADSSLTLTWFAAFGVSLALFDRKLHWRWRFLLGLAVLGELYGGMVIDRTWLAGWIPPLFAVATVICLGAPRIGISMVLLGLIGAGLNMARVVARLEGGDNLYSLSTRLEAWTILLKITAKNPVLGLGPANYYDVTPLFPIRGYAVNFSSHNTFVDLLAQVGAVGLACFAWWIWTIGRAGWRARARPSSGFTRAYVIGALGGLVGTLAAAALGDWLFPFVYNITLGGLRASLPAWLFLGALVGLSREPPLRSPRRRQPAPSPTSQAAKPIVASASSDSGVSGGTLPSSAASAAGDGSLDG